MKLSRIINASGKMTILGGSKVSDSVASKMAFGAQNLFLMEELIVESGAYLASLYGVESTSILASASAAIAQAIAASICGDKLDLILDPYKGEHSRREIVIAKGHNVDYGTSIAIPIQMGGGILKEAGYANVCSIDHVRACINENTAALLYVKSHHAVQKGMPDLQAYIELGHEFGLDVIVDAAAEGDLSYYHHLGADCVIYSGTKTFEGPTSGLVVGTHEFIDKLRLQSKGIGRVMKVGKEGVLGLMQALEDYQSHVGKTLEEQEAILAHFHREFASVEGIKSRSVQDDAGRLILRCELAFNPPEIALAMVASLKQGSVKIYTRDYRANEGKIELDIRDLSLAEISEIIERIKEEL